MLVLSNLSFSHGVFKSLVLQIRKNQGLFRTELSKPEISKHYKFQQQPIYYKMYLNHALEKGGLIPSKTFHDRGSAKSILYKGL